MKNIGAYQLLVAMMEEAINEVYPKANLDIPISKRNAIAKIFLRKLTNTIIVKKVFSLMGFGKFVYKDLAKTKIRKGGKTIKFYISNKLKRRIRGL